VIKLGVHVSTAGNIYKAVDRAVGFGCNTMQIFSRNPRRFRKEFLPADDIEIFKEKVRTEKISPVVVHIPYTLNLAATKYHFFKLTIKEFIVDLQEADKLGADYLVTHMGSYKGSIEARGVERVAKALDKILSETPGVKTQILLENTSGSGRWLGHDFFHQRTVFEQLKWPPRLGLCLDTAHAWAAGYKINDCGGVDALLNDIEEKVGLDRLYVVHLNDTREKLGSRRDKHFDIGKGCIGKKGFRAIVNHPRLKDLAFILETPKRDDEDDTRNLDAVRELVEPGPGK